jgi:RNA polymerase sigma-70 factor (ECF subfamily)
MVVQQLTAPTLNVDRFNQLMEVTYRKVYTMAYRLSGNRADAEDLTQEAYYRAFRNFSDYEGDRPFENWIFRIVTRLYLDLLRTRRRRVKAVSYDTPLPGHNGDENLYFETADKGPNPEEVMLEDSLSEDLQRVMASLTPEQRTLITLADIQDMPYAEIADILGKPVGTIRSRLHRTHKLIRSRLEAIRKGDGDAAQAKQNLATKAKAAANKLGLACCF